MKWTKVDHTTHQPIARNSGWHIVDYISGDYVISDVYGRWVLRKNGKLIRVTKTLKEAKAIAEHREET